MNWKSKLRIIKVACSHLVADLFPQDRGIFDDAWFVLLPTFEKWGKEKPPYRGVDLSCVTGLGFDEAVDWGLPIALMTTVATMLEIWDIGSFTKSGVSMTARKYAKAFGAPRELRNILEERVPSFCMELYEDIDAKLNKEDLVEWKRELKAAMPGRGRWEVYAIMTHKQKAQPATLEQVIAFKRGHKPKDYFLWIDESETEVLVDGEPLPLGPLVRKVLRYLVGLRGHRITYRELVQACKTKVSQYKTADYKTAGRWIEHLRKAGKGKLRDMIKTKNGGFAYEGPESFCIIEEL